MGNTTGISSGPVSNSPIHRSGIGKERTSSYWSARTSTDGGKTLHPRKAAKAALEYGDPHAAYRLNARANRKDAKIEDFDLEGFKPSFNKGLAPYKGKDGKTYSIPSDAETLQAIPKLGGRFIKFLMPGSLIGEFDKKKKVPIDDKSGQGMKPEKRVITSGDPTQKYNRTSLQTASKSTKNNKNTLLG